MARFCYAIHCVGGGNVSTAAMDRLSAFVDAEQCRFEPMAGIAFASSMAHVGRYGRFLALIVDRYEAASEAHIAETEAFIAAARAGSEYPDKRLEESQQLIDALHLEIEAFYLFAKILLDHAAHAIYYYFGHASGVRLFRHSVLVKRLNDYAAAKHLDIPDGFLARAIELRARIADYRDANVTHDNSSRTIYATIHDSISRKAQLAPSRLRPIEPEDQDRRSDSPSELLVVVNEYIEGFVSLLEANRSRTGLALIERRGGMSSELGQPSYQSFS